MSDGNGVEVARLSPAGHTGDDRGAAICWRVGTLRPALVSCLLDDLFGEESPTAVGTASCPPLWSAVSWEWIRLRSRRSDCGANILVLLVAEQFELVGRGDLGLGSRDRAFVRVWDYNVSRSNISRRVWEVFASGNLSELEDLVAPGAAFHDAQGPFGDQRGPEHMRSLMEMYRKSFSNMRFDIKIQITEGGYVCTMIEAQGDNSREITGQPATGKHSRVNLTDIDRIEDGKIAESWATWDTLSVLQQLGLISSGAP